MPGRRAAGPRRPAAIGSSGCRGILTGTTAGSVRNATATDSPVAAITPDTITEPAITGQTARYADFALRWVGMGALPGTLNREQFKSYIKAETTRWAEVAASRKLQAN